MAQRNYNKNRDAADINSYRGSSYYSYGNVAYDIEPEYTPYYPNEEHKDGNALKEKSHKAEVRENRVTALKLIAIIVLLFAGALVFMGMHVRVINEGVELRREKTELADLKSTNAMLQSELTEQIDLDYVKEQATTRLSMSEPQSFQVVYIDVPKQSYTVQYAADTADTADKESSSKFSNILSRLKKD